MPFASATVEMRSGATACEMSMSEGTGLTVVQCRDVIVSAVAVDCHPWINH
jgi:hypothetical protein